MLNNNNIYDQHIAKGPTAYYYGSFNMYMALFSGAFFAITCPVLLWYVVMYMHKPIYYFTIVIAFAIGLWMLYEFWKKYKMRGKPVIVLSNEGIYMQPAGGSFTWAEIESCEIITGSKSSFWELKVNGKRHTISIADLSGEVDEKYALQTYRQRYTEHIAKQNTATGE